MKKEKTTKENMSSSKDSTQAKPKVLSGIVVSDKMTDTIVVEVSSYEKHPKYEKYIRHRKRYKAHDAGNTKKVGEKVDIVETRPISKDKQFMVMSTS